MTSPGGSTAQIYLGITVDEYILGGYIIFTTNAERESKMKVKVNAKAATAKHADKIEAARLAGAEDFAAGKNRVPAQSRAVMVLVAAVSGDYDAVMTVMKAWLSGWDAENLKN